VYEDDLARAVLRGKQPHSEALLAVLAQLFWLRNQFDLLAAGIEVVVPIPQHWSQRWQRSHNPAQVLAENWAERLHVPCDQYLLRKTRRTPKQHTLSPTERRKSPRNAYTVASRHDLSGRTVLLADDVLTTGTTAQVAARLLLAAGAKRVLVAVIACGIGQPATA